MTVMTARYGRFFSTLKEICSGRRHSFLRSATTNEAHGTSRVSFKMIQHITHLIGGTHTSPSLTARPKLLPRPNEKGTRFGRNRLVGSRTTLKVIRKPLSVF